MKTKNTVYVFNEEGNTMNLKIFVTNPFTQSTKELEEISPSSSLVQFKKSIYIELGVKTEEQELLFLGKILKDEEKSLQQYGIENNTTVYLLKKLEKEEEKEEEMHQVQTIDDVKTLLSKAKNPAFRQMLKKYLQNKENIAKILNQNEFLRNDRRVSAILRDPEVSVPVIETITAEKIVNEIPNMGIALKLVLSSLSMTDSIGRHALSQNAEDDGDLAGADPAILAQAELMASNEQSIQQRQQRQQGGSNSQQGTSQSQASQISAADLANALSFATMTQDSSIPMNTAMEQPAPTQQNNHSEAIEQMRALGIPEAGARRALVMSHGNVEMAINLYFERFQN